MEQERYIPGLADKAIAEMLNDFVAFHIIGIVLAWNATSWFI